MAERKIPPASERGGPNSDQRWFAKALGDPLAYQAVTSHARLLIDKARSRHSRNRARMRIYRGTEIINNRQAVAALEQMGMGIAKLNATKSIIDTYVSRLAKERPMPAIQAIDADWRRKRRAEKYHDFIVGKWTETKFDSLSRAACLSSAIIGEAFTRIDDGEDDVFAENIPANELIFDSRECRYGTPRQAVRIRRVARDELAALYPKHKTEIWSAPASTKRWDEQSEDIDEIGDLDDYTDVYEPWYLPTSPTSEDGRTGLFLENVTLCYERWHEPRFPWAQFCTFKPEETGFHGNGFVDQLASLQHRVNCIVRDLQLNISATGRGHFLVNENNDIPTEMLTGFLPFKIKYKGGQPPTWQAPTMFNPAQLDALKFFIEQMFDLTGVSKANATSKSALGAGASAVALDTQYDIDSDRFRIPQGNYQDYRLDAGQGYVDASARVARKREEHKGEKKSFVAVSWKDPDAVNRLEYTKVMLKEGDYKLSIEAENFLPNTKAGKLAVVENLARAGVIPQWLVPTMFNEPDVQGVNRIILASFKLTMKKVDQLAEEDGYMPVPEPYNDLDMEIKLITAFYNVVQEENAPEEVQDRYRMYLDVLTEMIKQKNSQAATPPGMVGPGGEPMAPAEGPLPGGMPAMPVGPVPQPAMIGAPAQMPIV